MASRSAAFCVHNSRWNADCEIVLPFSLSLSCANTSYERALLFVCQAQCRKSAISRLVNWIQQELSSENSDISCSICTYVYELVYTQFANAKVCTRLSCTHKNTTRKLHGSMQPASKQQAQTNALSFIIACVAVLINVILLSFSDVHANTCSACARKPSPI